MPEVYLNPADLSPPQADRVLAFLNRATSAQQLAREVGFPPESGVEFGQRLLDARAALGGQFTDIAQVRAVRTVGPERFTEIGVAALGLDPRRWVDLFYGAAPMSASADTGLAVTFEARPQPAWLGQPLALVVRVADRGGVPRAAVPVTVQTGVGRLVWMYGFQRVEGQAITILSGADGSAVLDLLRPPSEPLSDVQDAALQVALAELDVNAGDPLKLEADFRALADLYLLERSYNLRRAVDLFVRDHREAMLAALNPGAWRLAWPIDSVLLQADAVPAPGGSSTARAVTTVVWKNWVGAWLEFLGDRLREMAGLDDNFTAALRNAKDSGVVTEMLSQAQLLVAASSGRSALWVGQKTAADAAVRLVSRPEMQEAPAEVQAALLTQLPVAAREIAPTTLGSYTLAKTVPKPTTSVDPKVLADITRLDNQVATLDQQNKELIRQNEIQSNEIGTLTRQNETQTKEIGTLAKQNDTLTKQFGTLAKQNDTLTKQVGTLQSDVGDVRGKLQLPPFRPSVVAPTPPIRPPITPPVGGPPVRPPVGPIAGPIVRPRQGPEPAPRPPRPARKRGNKGSP